MMWKPTPANGGLLAALVVVCELVPALVALRTRASLSRTATKLPSAPPPVAFSIVWPLLYLLAAGGLWLQCVAPSTAHPGVRWTGVALLAAQLVCSWVWTPVFAANKRREATWMVVGMLMATVAGIILAARTSVVAGALWAPYAAWLVFALVLCSESNRI